MSEEFGQNEFIYESQADLVIGIDFGTTFSGVAWAHTGSLTRTTDKRQLAQEVTVVKQWPAVAKLRKYQPS